MPEGRPQRVSLPVQFQRQLHLARRVGLTGRQAEGVAVQVHDRRPKYGAIEKIERLGAEIQAKALRQSKALAQADVFVQVRNQG